jgi:hypothetical protein
MDKPEQPTQYWFRAKRYGWGWGLPMRWQGWVALAAYGAVMTGAGLAAELLDPPVGPLVAGSLILISTGALIVVCIRTGEPARWRWGR